MTAASRTLFVEAGAGTGKTSSLVQRVVSLVVDEHVPLREIAAVTFTEKAAAELRDRLRKELKGRPERDDLDTAAVGTLHSFAQRLLSEHPIEAGLPPLIEVQDEVASGVRGDARWTTLRAALLDDERLTATLHLALAGGVRLTDLRTLTVHFNANWDLLADRVLAVPEPPVPPADVTTLVAEARRLAALASHCVDQDDQLLANLGLLADWADQLDGAPDDPARLGVLVGAVSRNWHRGRAPNWPGQNLRQVRDECRAVAAAAQGLRQSIVDATLRRLSRWIAAAVLDDAGARRAEGRLEFHDLLVLARELVRSPVHGAAVRARLQQRYRKILLDEFQDTDPIQIELAVRIAGGAAADADDWAQVAVPEGSLFLVGDPKQSIYRFRRADIATYLRAQRTIGQQVVLDVNYRTTAPVLAWINEVFGQLIVAAPDSQPPYRPLTADRAGPPPGAVPGPAVATLGASAHTDNPTAVTLREREAADVVAAVQTALRDRWQVADGDGWRDIELRDIAVLVPARTSLPQLEQALDAAGIGFHPGATSLVYRSREVRDLLTAARAVDDPSDALALVTALRSPLFGCGDDDLWTWKQAGGRFSLFAAAQVPPSHPVACAISYLQKLHDDRHTLAPSEVLGRLVTDRRMFEQAAGDRRHRDVWRRLRFVIDQARAWSGAEHGSLRDYLVWATRQGSDTARVAEAALPETDADTLKIMTIHSAKGLEFPMVIVSGLTTRIVRPAAGLQVLWPAAGGCELKLRAEVKTTDFDAAQPIDEQMSADEKMRLLYVACTRARDHLVVSVHRKGSGTSTSAELIAGATPPVPSISAPFEARTSTPPAFAPPPSLGVWTAAITASRTAAARPAAVSASGLEGLLPSVTDPGLAKGPRNLETAPWHKGRYGTAIGRAVHGVLQSVDLGTGAGLADAIAAQTLAEGVVPYTELVATLTASALAAPLIRRAAARPHWRESWVATTVGDTVLEGIVDLLFRDDDGLVVVDYKTDAVPLSALSARVDFYRPQLAAYAAAVEAATGETVARCVLLFLHPGGAEAWSVPELRAAITGIRAQLVT